MPAVLSMHILPQQELWWRQSNLCRTLSHLLLRILVLHESISVACLSVDIWALVAIWKLNLMTSELKIPPVPVPVPYSPSVTAPNLGAARSQAGQRPADTAHHKQLSHTHEQHK